MPLATVKTKKSASKVINAIERDSIKKDAKVLLKIFKEITGKKPRVWGTNNMIGFGTYKYKRKGSKEEHEWFNVGFAPRKDKITLYLTCYLDKEPLVKKLGKCTHGKVACMSVS